MKAKPKEVSQPLLTIQKLSAHMLGQQMWVSVGPWADSEVLKTDLL